MEQSALTTPVLNLNSTAIEIPLTFKQDEISEEVSYTGFVPVELPYYIDSDDAIVKRWEIICHLFFKNLMSNVSQQFIFRYLVKVTKNGKIILFVYFVLTDNFFLY